MSRPIYSYRVLDGNELIKYVLIGYIFVVILFIAIYFVPSVNKFYYTRYKDYEVTVDKKSQLLIKDIDAYTKEYYDNKISRWQMEYHLNSTANSFMSLYNSFRWNSGDEVTKELFLLKKQILLNYAEIYRNRSKAISMGIKSNELEEMTLINSLTNYYLDKDKLEKIKYKIPF